MRTTPTSMLGKAAARRSTARRSRSRRRPSAAAAPPCRTSLVLAPSVFQLIENMRANLAARPPTSPPCLPRRSLPHDPPADEARQAEDAQRQNQHAEQRTPLAHQQARSQRHKKQAGEDGLLERGERG